MKEENSKPASKENERTKPDNRSNVIRKSNLDKFKDKQGLK